MALGYFMELIKVSDLVKSYSNEQKSVEVLKGISLEVAEGETMAVLGASGAGKSTLLNITGALDRPTGGTVHYRGADLFSMDDGALATFRNEKVGFVFQSHHLLPEFTALENVMMPALIGGVPYGEVRKMATGLLAEVGLAERLSHKPGELSGGEQQRCAVVRALVQTPELVLADEPTGNLDAATGLDVFELLLDLNRERNITLIVVTHNEVLAEKLSRRLRMVDGKVQEI